MSSVPQFSMLKDVYMAIAGVNALMPALREAQKKVHDEVIRLRAVAGSDKNLQHQIIAYLYWFEESVPVASINEAFGVDLHQVRQIAMQEYPDLCCTQCGIRLFGTNVSRGMRRSLICRSCVGKNRVSTDDEGDSCDEISTSQESPTRLSTISQREMVAIGGIDSDRSVDGRHMLAAPDTTPIFASTDNIASTPIAYRKIRKTARTGVPTKKERRNQKPLSSRVQELRSMPYKDYLKSPEWNRTRIAALKRAGFTCQICNADNTVLNVHHRTYERLACERPADLIVLCQPCHEIFHTNGKLA